MPNLFGIIKLEFVLKSKLLIKYGRYETNWIYWKSSVFGRNNTSSDIPYFFSNS